ncbi:hypothetical protein N781_00440 [Pontibacillus halophilus JSM 076056 = DSM 19796]|uniref:Uncharacterized protein n=1 Tax=Pontibacillus halophilus JSM 076056 = DSM 19796 TaxID=1385510 RepID=A0A0A5GS49_9BACI|nr:hypothetical protein [Pontibacillus halophilus]KGX94048.1 hypothetical protein N781_00440 [Pontibacillus halophilus JSM 076056 = DSM 19796]
MAIFNFFTLNTAEQLDLFFSEDGQLDLDILRNRMVENRAPIDGQGGINGEGFISPNFQIRNDQQVVESFCASQGSLGYYNEARMINDNFTTQRIQHHYYSKSFMMITQKSDFIIKFDFASEEGTKSKVKSLIEEMGFEATIFRLDNELLRKIQGRFDWTAAKLDKIERYGDSTRRVSYEIDPADDQFPSQVDEDYREHGKMSHITFEIPYNAPGAPNTVTVKLYSQGHRIVIDEDELGGSPTEEFILYLLGILKGLKEEV